MDKQEAFDTICSMISNRCGITKEQLTHDTKLATIPHLDMGYLIAMFAIRSGKILVVKSKTEFTIGDLVDQVTS